MLRSHPNIRNPGRLPQGSSETLPKVLLLENVEVLEYAGKDEGLQFL